MDDRGLRLAESVWTRLDRKAGAIVELTIRQLRHRLSTWVVLSVGVLLMILLLSFYIDAVRESFEPIDNDGDSFDADKDGYPMGQERKYGTSDYNGDQYPGSSKFLLEGNIDLDDNGRFITGNYSWNGEALFEPVWVDVNYSGNNEFYWSEAVNWEEVGDCPEIDESDYNEQTWEFNWGSACLIGDMDNDGRDTYYVRGDWFGQGSATVLPDRSLAWGRVTEPIFIEPDPPELYIDEDGIDCFNSDGERTECPASDRLGGSHGFDDDGDCLFSNSEVAKDEGEAPRDDSNGNGIVCDVLWATDFDGNEVLGIDADNNVDEDPNDEEYAGELGHRTFIIGVGKIAFVLLLGLFLPLFLALGLVRDETENGTLHLLLSKPIHRGEFILYRLLGYLAVSGSYVLALSMIVGIIAAALGPGDQIFRFSDLPVWLGIGLATVFVLAAYGAIFNTMGLISPKYGVYGCIVFGVWEFAMGFFTILNPNWTVSSISVTHWALQMIDAVVLLSWPDTLQWAEMGSAYGINSALATFWQPPVHDLGTQSGFVALLVSSSMLLAISSIMIFIGQSVFGKREIM